MTDDTLASIVAAIDWPDRDMAQVARERWRLLAKPDGSLGRLEELGTWWSSVRGQCPPDPPQRAVLVIFAADHGIARTSRTSAYPPEVTAQMVRTLVAGSAGANALAREVGVEVRVVDVGVDTDPHYLDDSDPKVTQHRIRRGSGSIDVDDALSPEETAAAFAVGVAVADAEIDAGADLLIAGDMGIGNTTAASAISGLYAPADVVSVVGRGTGIDDATWMRKCAAVRDAMRRGRDLKGAPLELLAAIGGTDFAAMLGFLLQSAARRTPVILDGIVPTAVALIAHRAAFKSREWWQAGHRSPEPAHSAALGRLDLSPLLDLGMRLGEGTGALLAVPLVRAAAVSLRDIQTFDQAGVSERYGQPMTLRQTPLHPEHTELGAKMADFGGWDMPIEYAGAVSEHTAVRQAAGAFDVSHMGYIEVVGVGAVAWLNSIVTNDLTRIGDGEAQYSLLCDDSGGVIDDLIIYRVDADAAFIIPNAANVDAVVSALRAASPDTSELTITDASTSYGLIAVQGPQSSDVLAALGLPIDHAYMSFVRTMWDGTPVVVARTGYTGERGFELLVPVDQTVDLWRALVSAGAAPCGLGARDVLRTEMGYPLHGHELSGDISPVQAGLGWAVGWDKDEFAGRSALLAEKSTGPVRRLRGLVAVERAIPRAGMTVTDSTGAVLGELTSGTFSPSLGKGVGLALLRPDLAEGDVVIVDVRGRPAEFTVTKPPFVESHAR